MNISSIGMYTLGTTCYSGAFPIVIFDVKKELLVYTAIEFYTSSGMLLERFYVDLPNSIFTEYEFVSDRDSNISFKFALSELPRFQILRFMHIVWIVDGNVVFTGYIQSIPLQGDDRLNFSGHGMVKRLDKCLIVNPYSNYQIQSMTKNSNLMTVYLNGNIPNIDLVGLKVVVRECTEDKNNSKANAFFTIQSHGGVNGNWFIVYSNPSGLYQVESKGLLDILPPEWSYSNLRSTVIDYCMRNLTRNPIKYNPALIDETTGYITAGTVNFHGIEFSKFIKDMKDTLPERYKIGVNNSGYFYLKNESEEILDKYFEQYEFEDVELKEDVEGVVNNITLMRQGDGKKWSIAAIAKNDTSIGLYGNLAEKIDIPYAIEDGTAQLVADMYIQNNSKPKNSITLKDQPFKIYEFGYYGIVTKNQDYIFTINELDDLNNWITDGDCIVTISTSSYISGFASHKLDFTGNVLHLYNYDEPLNVLGIKGIGFYIQSNMQGLRIGFGIGKTNWYDNLFQFEFNQVGFFVPIFFSLDGLDEIRKIGFALNPSNSRSHSVIIDNIFILQNTNIHYSMPLKKQIWNCKDGIKTVELEFGMLENNKLADFVGNTANSIQNNTLMIRG
jgi:hypothetical protein